MNEPIVVDINEEPLPPAVPPPEAQELVDDAFRLNVLLRGELAACESYAQAAQHIRDAHTRQALEKNRVSHAARALTLSSLIRDAGGEPVSDAGIWGHLTAAVERAASLISDRVVLEALVKGEQLGLQSYLSQVDELGDEVTRESIWQNSVLEQRLTERRLLDLLEERDSEKGHHHPS
jgi:demethoxyubiquinone hydroxylase (CLK1/Coq7/Cat5 family)